MREKMKRKSKFSYHKRNLIGIMILAFSLSILQVIGYSFSKENSWDMWFKDGRSFSIFILIILVIGVIFGGIISVFWKSLDHASQNLNYNKNMQRKNLLIIAGVLFICWVPYLIIFYPCSANADVMDQLGQFFHIDSMCWTQKYVELPDPENSLWNNHHPVFHTLILGVFAQIGKQIGNIELGIFLLVILQAILMALVFSYSIIYIREEGASKRICIGIMIFFMLWPIHGITATTLCKDTLFNVLILYNTIQILKILKTPQILDDTKKVVLNIFTFILMGLLRNNGLYLLLLLLPVMLVLLKKYKKKVIILIGVPILFLGIFMPRIIFPMLKIAPGSEREMLSIPFQQIVRVMKEKTVEQEDLRVIEKTLAYEGENYRDIVKRYNPRVADSVKNAYNLRLTTSEKTRFLKVWLKYLVRYPGVYFQAAINNEYQYIYYERNVKGNTVYLYYNGISIGNRSLLGIKNNSKFKGVRDSLYNTIKKVQSSKVFGWIFNIGFYMCLLIVLMGKSLVNQEYRLFWGFSLIMGNILINFLSPIVYMRYAYYFIVSIPLYIGLMTTKKSEK